MEKDSNIADDAREREIKTEQDYLANTNGEHCEVAMGNASETLESSRTLKPNKSRCRRHKK